MTLEQNNVVRLSARDWAGIIGVALTLLTILGSAYLTHDRLLMQLVTQQESINRRLDKIEDKLDATPAHPSSR
jgi:hypothetical protein